MLKRINLMHIIFVGFIAIIIFPTLSKTVRPYGLFIPPLFSVEVWGIEQLEWNTPDYITFISRDLRFAVSRAHLVSLPDKKIMTIDEIYEEDSSSFLSLHPNGKLIATYNFDTGVIIRDFQNHSILTTIPIQRVEDFAWSGDGKYLAVLHNPYEDNFVIRVFSVEGKEEGILHHNFQQFMWDVGYLTWSPDNTKLIFIMEKFESLDRDMYVADLEAGTIRQVLLPNVYERGISWSAYNGNLLMVSWLKEKTLIDRILLVDLEHTCYRVAENISDVTAASSSPTSDEIAILSENQSVYVVPFSYLTLSKACTPFVIETPSL